MTLSDITGNTLHRVHRTRRLAVLLASAMLVLAAPAYGQDGRIPDGNAGTDQYVEPVPDAGGDRPASPGREGGGGASLPPGTRQKLPPGEEGQTLTRIGADPGAGAPSGAGRGSSGASRGDAGPASTVREEEDPTPFTAAADAVLRSGDATFGIVLIVALSLTLAVAAAGLRQRRRGPTA